MKLYRYSIDYGRMGDIEGVFFSTDEELKTAKGKEVYLDDVLGKHSEIVFDFDPDILEEIVLPDDVIKILFDAVGKNVSGINPLEFIYEDG